MEQIGVWYKDEESADKIFNKLYLLFKDSKNLEKINIDNEEYTFCFNNGEWIKILPMGKEINEQECMKFTKCYFVNDIDEKDIDEIIMSKIKKTR